MFVLYEQPGKVEFKEDRIKGNQGQGRANQKVNDFAQKYGLGQPIAGNFFQAQYDDYVPKLWAKLGYTGNSKQ